MELHINGKKESVPSELESVDELLNHLQLRKDIVVVEHNLKILKRDELSKTPLQENDSLEIIRLVGGG